MKDLSRAVRRHHRARLIKNRRNSCWWWPTDKNPKQLSILVRTPCMCSCHMCGNPRKYFGEITIQEIKHREAMLAGFLEI